MPDVTELDLPVLDYLDADLRGERFHDVLDGLRAQGWVAAVQPLGYVLLDHGSVDEVLRSPAARMPAIEILELLGVTSGPAHEQLSGNLINLQGETHRRLRALAQHALMPRVARDLRPAMRAHVHELLDAVDGEECDLAAALAVPYPARMIAEIVGVPTSDADRLGRWAYWIQGSFDPMKVANELAAIEQACVELRAYVEQRLAEEGDPDATDLLSTLRRAVDDGEIDADQCVHLVGSVLVGGVDTTQAQLAHLVRLLAEHPAQWDALRDDPDLVPAAVEEALRHEPITPFTARLVTEDLIIRDVTFPSGTVLFACAASANRDADVFDPADRFDLTAPRSGAKPLTFGAGPHYCIGASLARAELEEALSALLERVERIELTGAPTYDTPAGVYGLLELPVRLVGLGAR